MIFLSSVEDWKYRPLFPSRPKNRTGCLSETPVSAGVGESAAAAARERLDTSTRTLPSGPRQHHAAPIRQRFPTMAGGCSLPMTSLPTYLGRQSGARDRIPGAALLFALGFFLLERRHRTEQTELREILENMSAGIAVFDPNSACGVEQQVYQIEQLSGFRWSVPGDHMPRSSSTTSSAAIYGPGDPEKQLQERLDRAQQHAVGQFEVRRPEEPGSTSAQPDADGTLIQTYTDVTERKQAERSLTRTGTTWKAWSGSERPNLST